MAVVVIWVVIIIVFAIATNMRKQKQQDAQRKQAQQMTAGRQTAPKKPAPNPIVERAKQNTQDVHRTHVEHEKESYEQDRIRKTKARLQRELQAERTDQNSQTGRNRIMEAAKENALETRLDNLSDSSRNFMKEVQELMVKGPDDSLPNERDFVAEGMEMINNALIR